MSANGLKVTSNGQTIDAKFDTAKITEAGIPLIVKFLSKIAWDQQFDKVESLL
jgi:hypothetical protein